MNDLWLTNAFRWRILFRETWLGVPVLLNLADDCCVSQQWDLTALNYTASFIKLSNYCHKQLCNEAGHIRSDPNWIPQQADST